MNYKLIYLVPIILLGLFTSCEETKEISRYDNWKDKNEAYIDSLYGAFATPYHGGLDTIHLLSNPDDILMFKRIEASTEVSGYEKSDQRPLYTQKVQCYYHLSNILGEKLDGNFDENPSKSDRISEFEIEGGALIVGWTEALQRMTLGERWILYIPARLAYGEKSSGKVLGHSTLIFDLQLHKIIDK